MKLPLQVTFRNMDPSSAMQADVQEKADKLNQFFPDIMSCHVIVEARHRHHHQGNIYDVHIDLRMPNKEIIVSRDSTLDHSHEDAYVAIRDAFHAARRQLQDYSAQIKQHVKSHETPAHGEVLSLNPMLDYGIIRTPDGREVYFHRHSLLNTELEQLEEGDQVRFHEEMGEEGPQASSVSLEGKHHVVG